MNKKLIYKLLTILIVLLMIIMLFNSNVFAKINTSITIGNDMRKEAEPIGNKIVGAIKAVGIFVSVAMTMVVGIKYMVTSVEERAEYKKTAIIYLAGAILIFASGNVVEFLYKLVN